MQLKQLLAQHCIKQSALARAAGCSSAVISQLVNHNILPKKNPEALKERIENYLNNQHIVLPDDCWSNQSKEDEDIMNKELISQAARRQFGIIRDPFNDDINTHEDLYLSADQRYIRESMYQAAKHGGFVAVIGESGAGKSVLRRDLIDRIRREDLQIITISPVMPDKSRLTAANIGDAIIYDLDLNASIKRSQEAKARQMQKLLTDSSRAGNSHCLVIEEAHDLTLPVLKQLKRFWELEDGFKRLLSIILIGQPELKNKLNERMNWDAREVIRRCEIAELMPLDSKLGEYLRHKFNRVGVDSKFLTPDGIDAIQRRLTQSTRDRHVISISYPLIVNNLMVKILNHAANIGATVIDAAIVESV